MQRYVGWAQDLLGNALAGAQAAITVNGSGAAASLFSDNGSTPITGNVVTADDKGRYFFYAADGRYDQSLTAPGFAVSLPDSILLFDPADAGLVGLRGSFGAKGDGTTDDGAAILAWSAYLSSTGRTGIAEPGFTYLSSQQLQFHKVRAHVDGATFKFTGLSASTDCIVMQGSSQARPIHIYGMLDVDCNNCGRDALVIAGGKVGDLTSKFMEIGGFNAVNVVRDLVHFEPAGDGYWIEDFKIRRVGGTLVGRHPFAFILPNNTAVFCNQGLIENVNVRGWGKNSAGYGIFSDALANSYTGAKAANIKWVKAEFDAAGTVNYAGGIRFQKTGAAGVGAGNFNSWSFDGTFEDTSGTVVTGTPDLVTFDANALADGFTYNGIFVQYATLMSAADKARHANIVCLQAAGSGRNFLKLDGQVTATGIAPGTTASSDTAVLDYYGEGTFTPTVAFGGASVGVTYGTQDGTWTRIGNRVWFTVVCILTSKGSSTGALTIDGLPFTTGQPNSIAYSVFAQNLAAAINCVAARDSSPTSIKLYKITAGTAGQFLDTDVTNTSDFRVSGHFKV